MRRATFLPLALALAACSGGAERPAAPATVAPSTSAPATATPTTAASATTAAPGATTWPPPSIRVTTEREYVAFRTPTGNIACEIGNEGASCEMRDYTWRLPPKPRECEFDWIGGAATSVGHAFQLGLCRSDTVMGVERVLAYGTGVRFGRFTCVSERAGVTCASETGRGFFISRGAVREV